MAEGIGAQHLRFTLRGGGGERSFERTLWSTGHAPAIALSRDGGAVVARATRGGDVLPGATVRFSVSEPTRRFDRRADIVADEAGVARLELQPWPDTPVLVAAAVGGANVAVDWITVAADAAAAGQD
jgi:hypothetical protein